jgi:uncharacterized small protein (DUF1192 family)
VATSRRSKKPPSGRVGNFRAPVDTTGMSEEMKRTMGFKNPRQIPEGLSQAEIKRRITAAKAENARLQAARRSRRRSR